MPGLLVDSVRATMRATPQEAPLPGTPTSNDPLANLEEATEAEEQYVSDIWDQVAMRLYDDRIADQAEKLIRRAPQQNKAQAIIMASYPLMDVAHQAMLEHPAEPAEDAGQQLTTMIVDAVMEIADETGAAPYSDELATQALVGVRNMFVQNHPELFGGQQDGQLQPGTGPVGLSGRGGGLRQV